MRPEDALDLTQLRALVIASLRHNLRRAGRSSGLASGGRGGGLITLLLMQLLVGGVLSAPVWAGLPVFPFATLHFTFLMLTVAATLLVEAETLVVAPADYDLVAPRPVSVRTAFAARVTTLLAFVLTVAAAQGLPPVVAYFSAGGWHPARGVLGVLALLAVALTTAAAIVALHGLVLRHVKPARLRAALTVVQLTTSFLVYGLLVLLPAALGRAEVLAPLTSQTAWLRMLPGAWAASLLAPGGATWWGVLAAMGLPVASWWAASRWLAIDPAAQAAATSDHPERTGPGRVSSWFRSGESQAIALLVRAQFRHDMRFRLAVLAILPLTITYLLLGAVDRDMTSATGGHPAMVYVAVMIFPMLLQGAFARSDSHTAAWVFYASPVSAGRLLLGERTVLVVWFLGPYIAAIGVLLAYLLPSPGEAVFTAIVLALLAHALLLLTLLADPVLPFSRAPRIGASTSSVLIATVPAVFLGQLLPRLLNDLAASVVRAAATLCLLAAANVVIDRALRRRADRLAAQAEFSS